MRPASWPTRANVSPLPADPRAAYPCQLTHVRPIPTSWPTCGLFLPDNPRAAYPYQLTHVQSIPPRWPTRGLSLPDDPRAVYPCEMTHERSIPPADPRATHPCQHIYVLPLTHLPPIPVSWSTCYFWPTCYLFLSADLRATLDQLATYSFQLLYVLTINVSWPRSFPSLPVDLRTTHSANQLFT